LIAALTLAIAGCGAEDADPTPLPEPLVEVPSIEGAVAPENFCDLADRIRCAGAVECCSDKPAFASVDACVQESGCQAGFDKLLASPAVADGSLVYDPEAAGDHLRAEASRVSQCADAEAPAPGSAFVGTRDVDADCSPQGADRSNTLTCKPGLECALSLDAMTGVMTGRCKAAPPPPDGTCSSGEDCGSGICEEGRCAPSEAAYCFVGPEEPTPPANADPTHLYIDLGGSNSGTSGDVTIIYANGGKFWQCTITDTLSDGQEKVCTVTTTGTVTNSTNEFFKIEMPSNDGMKLDTVCSCSAANTSTNKCTTAVECAGTFFDPGDNGSWSEGCSWDPIDWGHYCSHMWLDNDGHGNCTKFQINSYDDNYTFCID